MCIGIGINTLSYFPHLIPAEPYTQVNINLEKVKLQVFI
jgi:hypothetical protein